MPAPKHSLKPADIRRLLDEGWSYAEIAEKYGYEVQSLRNSVSREKYKVPDLNPTPWQFAPWWVKPIHTNSGIGRRLLFAHRLQQGETVSPKLIADDVKAWLEKLDHNDFVVSYHPDTPGNSFEPKGGFFLRPRRPGDSPGIMQLPNESECPPSQAQIQEWAVMFE